MTKPKSSKPASPAAPPVVDQLLRLQKIAKIIEAVDERCLEVDGPVSTTREEISSEELLEIYCLARGVKYIPKAAKPAKSARTATAPASGKNTRSKQTYYCDVTLPMIQQAISVIKHKAYAAPAAVQDSALIMLAQAFAQYFSWIDSNFSVDDKRRFYDAFGLEEQPILVKRHS